MLILRPYEKMIFILRTCELITALTLLAFIPVDKVLKSFEALYDFYTNDSLFLKFREFLNYFKSTWIHGIFPIELWNFSKEINNFEWFNKTNNCIESFHNVLFCLNEKVIYIFSYIVFTLLC